MNLIFSFGLAFIPRCFGQFPVVENGIANRQTSSDYDPIGDIYHLHLDFSQSNGGYHAWVAGQDTNQWVQLSIQEVVTWNEITTQGRGDDDQWVTSFTVDYTENGVDWLSYDNSRVFSANSDRNTLVNHVLSPTIVARSIKIKPVTYSGWPALRLEAYVSEMPAEYTLVPSPDPIPAIQSGLRVTSSSDYTAYNDVSRVRLYFNEQREGSAAWCAAGNDIHQWLQVSNSHPMSVTKVSTQGRDDFDQWVTSYYMTYTENGIDWYPVDGKRVFVGNCDRSTVVTNEFDQPFVARAVRLHPTLWYGHTCLRMELYFYEV